MDKGLIDLHVHTTFSKEGIITTPEDVIRLALANGVDTLAITDHNTTLGCIKALQFIKSHKELCKDLQFITGIEVSCDTTAVSSFVDSHEHLRSSMSGGVHILGYGIDPTHPKFLEMAKYNSDDTGKRTLAIAKYIKRFYNIDVNKEELYQLVSKYEIKMHYAPKETYKSLIKNLFNSIMTETANAPFKNKKKWDKFQKKMHEPDLYQNCMYRIKSVFTLKDTALDNVAKMDVYEALTLIHDAGGVAVLAHPNFYRPKHEINITDFELLEQFLDKTTHFYNEDTGEYIRGILGIELLHGSSFDDQFRFKFFNNLAQERGLYITGGSDSHLSNKRHNTIGYIKGNFSISSLAFVKDLHQLRLGNTRICVSSKRKNITQDDLIYKFNDTPTDQQAILINSSKQVTAEEIVETQIISKKLNNFEKEITSALYWYRDKLLKGVEAQRIRPKAHQNLEHLAKVYQRYLNLVVQNQSLFFGKEDAFYDWLQRREDFATETANDIQELIKMDTKLQQKHDCKPVNHFTSVKHTFKEVSSQIEQQTALYGAKKVLYNQKSHTR
ncbi:MAG: PHP domain-containing protein [Clostridia bacterium]|nr:PHP domain-containing protein [Clostridia bacterium]